MSNPLDGQNARGKNGSKEGHNLAIPTDLLMVPSLGTWAEKQGIQAQSSENIHLNNPMTMPERIRPTEITKENRTTTSTESETTETNHKQLESEQGCIRHFQRLHAANAKVFMRQMSVKQNLNYFGLKRTPEVFPSHVQLSGGMTLTPPLNLGMKKSNEKKTSNQENTRNTTIIDLE